MGQHPVSRFRLDPDNARGGKVGDFFEKVEFIPLETTPKSLFGKIYKLEVTDTYFIIFDVETQAILLFTTDGKFHAKIEKRKKNEFIGPFGLDRKAREIMVPTSDKLILFYNYDGKLLREQKTDMQYSRIFAFENGTYALNKSRGLEVSKTSEIEHDILFTKNFKDVSQKLSPYDRHYQIYDYNMHTYLFSDQGNGSFIFSFPYAYNIFKISQSGIIDEFQFIFPTKYSLPNNFATDTLLTNSRKNFVFNPAPENMNKILSLAPFYQYQDWLLFSTDKIGGYISNMTDLMYNTKTKDLYSLNAITGDEISQFFPVLQEKKGQKMLSVFNGALYSSFASQSYSVTRAKLLEDGQKISLPELPKKSNPFIIKSVFKTHER
jgi:hypothetical protein